MDSLGLGSGPGGSPWERTGESEKTNGIAKRSGLRSGLRCLGIEIRSCEGFPWTLLN